MFEFGTREPMHDPYGVYRSMLQQHADAICEKLTKRLIRQFQLQASIFKADAGLKSMWEEICVSLREDSVWSSIYEENLELTMQALIEALPSIELQTIWLMTYDGVGYATSPEWYAPEMPAESGFSFDEKSEKPLTAKDAKHWPINKRHIAREVLHEYVQPACWSYENARIRKAEEQ